MSVQDHRLTHRGSQRSEELRIVLKLESLDLGPSLRDRRESSPTLPEQRKHQIGKEACSERLHVGSQQGISQNQSRNPRTTTDEETWRTNSRPFIPKLVREAT